MSTLFLCEALYASTSAWARTWVAARLHIVIWVPSSTPALADPDDTGAGVELEPHPTTATRATVARADSLNGFLIPCSSPSWTTLPLGTCWQSLPVDGPEHARAYH